MGACRQWGPQHSLACAEQGTAQRHVPRREACNDGTADDVARRGVRMCRERQARRSLVDALAVESLPAERRQQRGVDVEHRPVVRAHQLHRYQLQVLVHIWDELRCRVLDDGYKAEAERPGVWEVEARALQCRSQTHWPSVP